MRQASSIELFSELPDRSNSGISLGIGIWRSSRPVLYSPMAAMVLQVIGFTGITVAKTAGFEGYLAGLRGMGIGQV